MSSFCLFFKIHVKLVLPSLSRSTKAVVSFVIPASADELRTMLKKNDPCYKEQSCWPPENTRELTDSLKTPCPAVTEPARDMIAILCVDVIVIVKLHIFLQLVQISPSIHQRSAGHSCLAFLRSSVKCC